MPPSSTAFAVSNPYLTEVVRAGAVGNHRERLGLASATNIRGLRDRLVDEYAWAIPNDHALRALARLAPIVEIGAGRGYWARMLRDRGVDVLAYDIAPPDGPLWTDVEVGGVEKATEHSDRTLLLCWPPASGATAKACLAAYLGRCVVYVGEPRELPNGAAGEVSLGFMRLLEQRFEPLSRVTIPQWAGQWDDLSIWTRKAA